MPEHKCTHEMQRRDGFKRAQNKTNSRETMDRICAIYEACGSSKCQSARSVECPEHTRTKFTPRLALSPKGRKLHTSSEKKLSTVPYAQTTRPSARRCQNRLAEPTVPGVESQAPLVWQTRSRSCSNRPVWAAPNLPPGRLASALRSQ